VITAILIYIMSSSRLKSYTAIAIIVMVGLIGLVGVAVIDMAEIISQKILSGSTIK
jgi:hypothetical protein